MDEVFPDSIRWSESLKDPKVLTETEALKFLSNIADENCPGRCFIGQGYYDTVTPPVIRRNIMENPAWYTAYTPYQSEISQGRLEALLNFQTCVSDLTDLPVANASLLDEATAAAEAMTMFQRAHRKGSVFLISEDCHPQTIDLVKTRAEPMGLKVIIGKDNEIDKISEDIICGIFQYPGTLGDIKDPSESISKIKKKNGKAVLACDLLALAKLKTPAELGADIAVGNSQRFGIPMGYGGPHAAFFATKDEFKRSMPGRIIGVSVDRHGNKAYRLALQTREQHIRRDKATSNICTAQALLAIVSAAYAIYHGPNGIKKISERVSQLSLIHI